MVSDEVRNYFKDSGLTYESITEGDMGVLFILLNKHVKQSNKAGDMSVNTMRMSAKIKGKYKTNGVLKECYFFINSHYFTQREAISFNKDGFIGIAGWADSFNKVPIIKALKEWVDILAKKGGNYND